MEYGLILNSMFLLVKKSKKMELLGGLEPPTC